MRRTQGCFWATAGAVGGNHGEMIDLGSSAALAFNWMSDMPPEAPDDIATERGVSIETVPSQIRGLMTKTDTRRQSELVALLGRYV